MVCRFELRSSKCARKCESFVKDLNMELGPSVDSVFVLLPICEVCGHTEQNVTPDDLVHITLWPSE